MNKKFILIPVLAILLFAGCVACSPQKTYDLEIQALQSQISELQSLCENLQNTLNNALGNINDNQQMITEYQNELAEYQKEMRLLNARVENLSMPVPEFTAESPGIPSNREKEYEDLVTFDHFHDATVSFDDFAQYCKNNYSDYNFLLLSPIESDYDFKPLMHRVYSVLSDKEETFFSPIFYERLYMSSEILGYDGQSLPEVQGSLPYSINMEIYILPIEEPLFVPYIKLEFGEKDTGYYKNYVNLYSHNKCFATCYYKTFVPHVSRFWFENYFKYYLKVFFA